MNIDELSEKSRRHLELEYSYNKFPDDETKAALSQLTGLSIEEVSFWFVRQNYLHLPPPRPYPLDLPETALERSTSPSRGHEVPGSEVSRKDLHTSDGSFEPTFSPEFHARQLELRSPRAKTTVPGGNGDTVASSTNAKLSDNLYETFPKKNFLPDGKDDEDESDLPGYMVFAASGEGLTSVGALGKRRRKKFDASTRAEVAKIRKIGACLECRYKKVRCVHALQAASKESLTSSNQTLTSPFEIPPYDFSFFPEDIVGYQPSETSEFTIDNHRGTKSPATGPGLLDWELNKKSIMELFIIEDRLLQDVVKTMTDKYGFVATEKQYMERVKAWGFDMNMIRLKAGFIQGEAEPKSHSTDHTEHHKPPGKTASPAPDADLEICSECGFKPVGDPKWYKSNLARHMRIQHSGDKAAKYVCPQCDKHFSRSDNLRVHLRRTHGINAEQLPKQQGQEGTSSIATLQGPEQCAANSGNKKPVSAPKGVVIDMSPEKEKSKDSHQDEIQLGFPLDLMDHVPLP